jgi:hypothetical protein
MKHQSIQLGDRVKDLVTGFTGVVTARCEYINGCVQFGVSPPCENGKMQETQYIDYKRLKIRGKRTILPVEDTGGPMFDAPKQ